MGAFNYVEVDGACPTCGAEGAMRCQVHVASSFDGDEHGRFCNQVYRVGERMRWWPPIDRRHPTWRDGQEADDTADAVECCYADCLRCGAPAFVVLRFVALVPTEVLALGRESDWPSDYLR